MDVAPKKNKLCQILKDILLSKTVQVRLQASSDFIDYDNGGTFDFELTELKQTSGKVIETIALCYYLWFFIDFIQSLQECRF